MQQQRVAPGGRLPVLVVDDDRDTRELVCDLLEQEGFRPMRAYHGREAMLFMRSVKPCFVVLDLAMPEMNGWEVLAAMKGDAALASVPVVVVASRPLKNAGVRRSDVTAYFEKPLDIERFVDVADILRRRRLHQDAAPASAQHP